MFLRRCGFAALWIVLALYVLRHPTTAADSLTAVFSAMAALADALSAFVTAL
ncbi:hypothetical protein [Actinomadura rugatobispora]|uniref:Uncharacterized protein n=1 Tax=Actinomadura rugatobispora TaxID=1994 RepID=A0ABW1A5F5_9ACTN|nr:hypothetical protein GCM10010200_048900 [Actinomadura rugatobispora]